MAPPPDNTQGGDRELASAVLGGTVIGRSLRQALACLVREHHDANDVTQPPPSAVPGCLAQPKNPNDFRENDRSGDNSEGRSNVSLDRLAVNRILKSFRDAVAETPKDKAPRALLKGRCNYYNRFNQNWMVSMDDVRLKSRPTKLRKRKRLERASLWDRDETSQGEVRITEGKRTLQLLAYGDTA